ncbi:hypothetical protein B484DRAFT_416812 [Ochromonadaceae sp. CCMP2298]|nr:hypothetical protein B484DRAFT_416812 [Ochromonadaceae sp. CCMP2298]|mmetsp:Transcript_28715/g.63763  ORF Transcript_28715/g.63763 Transcript_28715/m.63763 type:complete len:372 (-) Transcript_28715:46-1161(-)|eukprot:CAMPEP_0173323718 /NCGR_PEP_ID=MMETSP1143-20121109/30669_1 /TAXON_ID=483371 /ORGANISM="non described non described, Strain CCMP2298" /LENGTH=371 /DNA_ID=CAMNT_0014267707 /DNA_START=93 /DNA_END=1205 /DNA_ORIENTATION=+
MFKFRPVVHSCIKWSRFCSTSAGIVAGTRVPLPQSAFLQVSGPDTIKFLQGLCTNELSVMGSFGACLPNALLTSKGRLFAGSIMYTNSADEPSLVIEVHQSIKIELQRYLSMYKLRSKVKLVQLEAEAVFTPTTLTASQLSELHADSSVIVAALDPRLEGFGSRIVYTKSPASTAPGAENEAWYDRYKLLHGFADGPELANRIPLECNLDQLNYISFKKGCYIGQELTARTKFKGLVRKRLVPFLVAPDGSVRTTQNAGPLEPLPQSVFEQVLSGAFVPAAALAVGSKVFSATTPQGKSIGEVVHLDASGSVGLVMMNIAALESAGAENFIVRKPTDANDAGEEQEQSEGESSDTEAYISTFKPAWFQLTV